ncbi:MAG TPA: surface-adhesin E family protein [Caulobacteraceae bacterium]|jgi:hypothetical protein
MRPRLLTAAALAAAVATPALALDPPSAGLALHRLAQGDGETWYGDAGSRFREESRAYLWVLVVFDRPQTRGGQTAAAVWSRKLIDCDGATIMTSQIAALGEDLSVVARQEDMRGGAQPAPAGSLWGRFADYACGRPLQNVPEAPVTSVAEALAARPA